MTRPAAAVHGGRRVWSLLELMKQFDAASLLIIKGAAGNFALFHELRKGRLWSFLDLIFKGPLPLNRKARIKGEKHAVLSGMLDLWSEKLTGLDLPSSASAVRKMREALDSGQPRFSNLYERGNELQERLLDELEGRLFLSLTLREADFYSAPQRGWEQVVKRFPAATTDIEEMSRCFALGRYAAAVFHSVQVVEVGLAELCKALESKDPHSGWTAAAKALERVINKKHQDRTDFERKHFAFFEQVQGTVEGLKNAWRNKISHAQGRLAVLTPDFTPDATEEIILASRAFMRRLATEGPTAQATILEFPGQDRREAQFEQ